MSQVVFSVQTVPMMCGCEDVVQSCVVSVSISVSPVVFPELSLTSHNLSTVLDSMADIWWDWFSNFVNIPRAEIERIESKYSHNKERKQAAIYYLISSHPAPSWRLVASALYQMGILRDNSPHRSLARLQQLFPTGTCSFWYPPDLYCMNSIDQM